MLFNCVPFSRLISFRVQIPASGLDTILQKKDVGNVSRRREIPRHKILGEEFFFSDYFGGYIPGSVNVPLDAFIDKNNKVFISKEEIQTRKIFISHEKFSIIF